MRGSLIGCYQKGKGVWLIIQVLVKRREAMHGGRDPTRRVRDGYVENGPI